jgi:CTP:molybdopterin cytidylyltransferase MocA
MGSSNYNAIILAAGKSQRIGKPKFSLQFDKNKSFLEKIIAEYVSFGCYKIIVVINPESKAYFTESNFIHSNEFEVVVNQNPEIGRFSSIKTGLKMLSKSHPTFIQNVDNPFVDASLLQLLAHSLHKKNGICPAFKKTGGHPLLLSEILVENLKTTDYDTDFKQYLKIFDIQKLEVSDFKVLVNINTAEEYKKWFSSL